MTATLILASASPRRQDLLAQFKLNLVLHPVDLDETPWLNEEPLSYVQRMAAEKSALCLKQCGLNFPVLAADTAVVLAGKIMGKPKDQADGLAMLSALSGRTHQVLTALSLRGDAHWQSQSRTEVTFRNLTEAEILRYWATGEPCDKAGAYAIQGLGSVFVQSLVGSYTGVVGLPLFETAHLLAKQGIALLP